MFNPELWESFPREQHYVLFSALINHLEKGVKSKMANLFRLVKPRKNSE